MLKRFEKLYSITKKSTYTINHTTENKNKVSIPSNNTGNKKPVLTRGKDGTNPTKRIWDHCENLQLSIRSGSAHNVEIDD